MQNCISIKANPPYILPSSRESKDKTYTANILAFYLILKQSSLCSQYRAAVSPIVSYSTEAPLASALAKSTESTCSSAIFLEIVAKIVLLQLRKSHVGNIVAVFLIFTERFYLLKPQFAIDVAGLVDIGVVIVDQIAVLR